MSTTLGTMSKPGGIQTFYMDCTPRLRTGEILVDPGSQVTSTNTDLTFDPVGINTTAITDSDSNVLVPIAHAVVFTVAAANAQAEPERVPIKVVYITNQGHTDAVTVYLWVATTVDSGSE